MKKSDCFSCHFISEQSYAPSYLRIAERYKTREVNIRDLGTRVQTGGGGLWGGAQMSRHPFLKEHEVDAMVTWVLSLADREAALKSMYEETPLDRLIDTSDGLKVMIYSDKSGLYPKDSTDLYATEAKTIGRLNRFKIDASTITSSESFPTVVVATGKLQVPSKGKYFFRLRGKKTGCLYINGEQIISILESDQEALIELKTGNHEIRIETLLRHSSERVVLEWIAPGNEYYTMVPAEHFSH